MGIRHLPPENRRQAMHTALGSALHITQRKLLRCHARRLSPIELRAPKAKTLLDIIQEGLLFGG